MDIISELRNPSVIARPFGVKVIMYVYADAHTICDCGKGAKLADIADSTGDEMNFMGITGFMENMAISILCQTWQYGETLRRWHNKRYNRSNNKKKNKK